MRITIDPITRIEGHLRIEAQSIVVITGARAIPFAGVRAQVSQIDERRTDPSFVTQTLLQLQHLTIVAISLVALPTHTADVSKVAERRKKIAVRVLGGSWNDYERAVCDMVERTSTEIAPWTLVEAEDKYYARIKILNTITDRLKQAFDR